MKTETEWMNWACKDGPLLPDFIRAIQLDAKRAGMTEAAEIVAKNWNGQESNYCELIETARDNLKLP